MMSVSVESVSYSYTRGTAALRDVSFELPAGAVLGVFGPNGAGKTTLLQCVAGLRELAAGTISVGGVPSANRALIEQGVVTFVSESIRLPNDMTLNALLRWVAPLYRRWNPALARSLVERFQLDATRRVTGFPGGEYLKAALVCAQSATPEVLFLTERFASIEVATREATRVGTAQWRTSLRTSRVSLRSRTSTLISIPHCTLGHRTLSRPTTCSSSYPVKSRPFDCPTTKSNSIC